MNIYMKGVNRPWALSNINNNYFWLQIFFLFSFWILSLLNPVSLHRITNPNTKQLCLSSHSLQISWEGGEWVHPLAGWVQRPTGDVHSMGIGWCMRQPRWLQRLSCSWSSPRAGEPGIPRWKQRLSFLASLGGKRREDKQHSAGGNSDCYCEAHSYDRVGPWCWVRDNESAWLVLIG